jgi:hypothetical protein
VVAIHFQIIHDYEESDNLSYEQNKWLVLHRNLVQPSGHPISEICCYWNKSITLTFNANTNRLEFIYVGEGYQGKLLGLLGIGDRLDSVKIQYNFHFEGDNIILNIRKIVAWLEKLFLLR